MSTTRIAVDAMGGDHAPEQIIKGAFEFLDECPDDLVVILVGDEEAVTPEVEKYPFDRARLEVAHASQVISMHERPARIMKTKPDSSVVRSVELVKTGRAAGVISAGSTGALLTAALFLLRRVPGVRRPAISPLIPTAHGGFLLCDAGANVDVKASDLVQFALMARAYSQHLINLPNPRVGLLNIGTEIGKGNELTIQAYPLLVEHVNNFVGNVEPRDLFTGVVDVAVCDGFVGNLLLKYTEGWIGHTAAWAREKLSHHRVSQFSLPLISPALNDLAQALDYEEHGGSPLLGVNGVAVVCHGSSSAKAIKNALKTAIRCVAEELTESIRTKISQHLDIIEEKHAATA